MRIASILLLFAGAFVLSGCKESDEKYLSKFIEGELRGTETVKVPYSSGVDTVMSELHSGFLFANEIPLKQKARIIDVIQNKPGDFPYAEVVPYTLVLGRGPLSSNRALRSIEVSQDGRGFTWQNAPPPEKPNSKLCQSREEITPYLVEQMATAVNIVKPAESHRDYPHFEKIAKLRKGDVILYEGRFVRVLKKGDPEEQTLSSNAALGPPHPALAWLMDLRILNHQYTQKPDQPVECVK